MHRYRIYGFFPQAPCPISNQEGDFQATSFAVAIYRALKHWAKETKLKGRRLRRVEVKATRLD